MHVGFGHRVIWSEWHNLCMIYFLEQKYMFAVFERTLLTDVGKSFVHDHEDDANTQEVYKAVVDY